jgi:REP element-mobilizing transposase RayT
MQHRPHTPPRLREVFQSYDSPVYFVTFCTANRQPLLAATAVYEAFCQYALRGAVEKHVAVGRYVIMPDHVHLFVCGGRDFDLGLWVRGLKRVMAAGVAASVPDAHAGKPAGTAGATLWQSGFFDHMLRHEESYGQKWEYVRQNPVRAGLVAKAEDWPYQGEIVALDRV